MKKDYIANVESNGAGWYSVYCNAEFPFGFFGEGATIEEAKRDFLAVFDAMCAKHKERTGEVVEATFSFVKDTSAILQEIKDIISLRALSEITGISKTMLSQYACGTRHPKPVQRQRIIDGIHQMGNICLSIQ